MLLKIMKCEFILLLVFQTVIAVTVIHVNINNFELEYFVTYENWCKSDRDRFQFIVGISIEQCVAECSARGHCSSLIYRNQINGCELFLTAETEQSNPGECAYVKKDNINVIKNPCQDGCNYGHVCESINSQRGECKVKECINTTTPENGIVLGNERGIGRKIRYMCNPGYKPKNDGVEPVAECLHNAQWSHITECVKILYIWTTWSSWGHCSLSCGGGVRTRQRTCSIPSTGGVNGTDCEGNDQQPDESKCNEQDCPTPTFLSSCTIDTDCIEKEGKCTHGFCLCKHTHFYDDSTNNCTLCNKRKTSFVTLPNRYIKGHQFGSDFNQVTVKACETECIKNESCFSFDYWGSSCSFQKISLEMAQSASEYVPVKYDSDLSLHFKDCVFNH